MTASIIEQRRKSRLGIGRVFAIPSLLFLATLAGLVLGLTGDGLPDWAAWFLLSLPILAAVRAWLGRD